MLTYRDRDGAAAWRYHHRFGSADDPLLLIMGIGADVGGPTGAATVGS
jgi:hypothetical protein